MLSSVLSDIARIDSVSPSMSHRVLLLAGDEVRFGLLRQFLAEHWEVKVIVDASEAVAEAANGCYDVVLLDLFLPRLGGLEALRLIRTRSDVPVIMLAGAASGERIAALQMGADDCVGMPMNYQEVVARVQAHLRRYSGAANSSQPIEVGSLRVDPRSRRAWVAGTPIDLTSAEYLILEMLMRAGGRVVTRERLVWTLRQREPSGLDRSLDVHVAHLRNKIGRPSPIRTVRGEGYFFCCEPVE